MAGIGQIPHDWPSINVSGIGPVLGGQVRTRAGRVRLGMTDRQSPDDTGPLAAARQAAVAHTAAARDVEAYLRRMPAVPGPADITEYATLVAREEAIRAERNSAVDTLGIDLPTLNPS